MREPQGLLSQPKDLKILYADTWIGATELPQKLGFSVVAPISVTQPFSTAP